MRIPILIAGVLTLAGGVAAQAQTATDPASDGLWQAAHACGNQPDRQACWRRVAATWPSPLRTPGTSDESVDLPPEFETVAASGDAFGDLAARTVTRLASGDPPAEALEALKALPVLDPAFVPNPLSDMSIVFGRLDAYALVASVVRERGLAEAERAVLAAWEADLPADSAGVSDSGAETLAADFARLGDHAAVERVLTTLEPENAPQAVRELVRHGRLDAATAVAARMTPAEREAGLRREATIELERYRTRVLPLMQAAMRRQLEGEVADLPASERPAALAALEEMLGLDEAMVAQGLADEDWRGRARDEVEDARATLVRAAVTAGRTDIARPLALAMWDEPVNRDVTGANALMVALPVLAGPEAPDAAARLTEAERRLRGRDRRTFPLKILYDSWVRIGRQDQADALLQRWRGFAERQPEAEMNSIGADLARILIARDEVAAAERVPAFNVLMLLQHDREAGVGAARLEERIAGRDYETQRTMLGDCSYGAPVHGAFDMAEACIRRRMAYSEILPLERWGIAQALVNLGVELARKGDHGRGEALIAEGLAFSPGPPEPFMSSDISVDIALETIVGPPAAEAPRALMR
ncbi:hypothetical protein GCM10009422_00160 [Brevundimonas kwangchunensis]|uniref:Uncharacterized protein n=1 Tax=Brevundimonas kwangchunensis TaxID=322163 RepID=A0ABN1GDT3_9CAUL